VRDLQLEGVGEFGEAVLHRLDAELVGRLVASRVTPVLPGGHVVRLDGEIVMLGTGGADLTAVALAAALGAVPCHFLLDRPGRSEPNVRRIHAEAVERARSLGVRIATRTFELGATLQAEERGASAPDAFTQRPGGPL